VNGVLQADQLCSEKVTSNYYSVQSQRAAVNIERGNNYTPTLGRAGTLTVQGNQEFTSKNETSAKNVGQITYNEAGSIEVRFSGEGNGNIFISDDANLPNGVPSIETSSVHMGRFYPDHFTLVSSQVTNAMTSGASPFTYMGQTFDISFLVEARNRDEAVTSNYHAAYLTPTAIESLQLNAVDSSNTDRTSRLDTSSMPTSWNINWIDGVNNLNDTDLVFDRDQTAVLPLTTSPDGPYIITLNLQADHNSCDFCTEFDGDGTAELSGDLVSRYGRIALSDVGGTVDATIKVPLQTQYWNGDQFIINDDDQETVFDGEGYCRRQISPNAGGNSNGQLNESDTVENGSSQSLTASRSPASSDREQVKLWLRLQSEQADEAITCSGISGNTDWLMYNWDKNGDEDPSAIVTFGIHRGNDRVIFRGETRMTGN
jgi:MSHA biogenesis protein MshQ